MINAIESDYIAVRKQLATMKFDSQLEAAQRATAVPDISIGNIS